MKNHYILRFIVFEGEFIAEKLKGCSYEITDETGSIMKEDY